MLLFCAQNYDGNILLCCYFVKTMKLIIIVTACFRLSLTSDRKEQKPRKSQSNPAPVLIFFTNTIINEILISAFSSLELFRSHTANMSR